MTSFKVTPKLEGAGFNFKVGQYIKLSYEGRESYFAMTSEPEEKHAIEFLVKDEPGTLAFDLGKMKSGEILKVSAPMGPGYPIERMKGKNILLVAIGTGIAPLRSLLKSMLRRPEQFKKITLLYGIQTPEHIPYKNDFKSWKGETSLKMCYSDISQLSGDFPGFLGRVTELLLTVDFDAKDSVACVCGTKSMEEETRKILVDKGILAENIFFNF